VPTDDPTQILSEIKRLAKQFLLLEGYTPVQTIVEEELLPIVDKSQHVLGGGDQDPSSPSKGEEQSSEEGSTKITIDFGTARKEALSNVRATGNYAKSAAEG
jgi:hypothetical protein